MGAWLDSDDAVYPYDAVHGEVKTDKENQIEGQVQMITSQDSAIAVAQQELGLEVTPLPGVALRRWRAAGRRQAAGARPVPDDRRPAGGHHRRGGARRSRRARRGSRWRSSCSATTSARRSRSPPKQGEEGSAIGIYLGTGFRFPFDVTVNISPDIGGPSAGLMFSLAIYDTLTPGSLTDGQIIAGTGEIAPNGRVGAIGGIQQKVVAARDSGAELFLVPGGQLRGRAGRRQRRHAAGARRDHARAPGWRSRRGRPTTTPTCPAART